MTSAYNQLHRMIELVAGALGEALLQEVAFVGGATTGLLVTDPVARDDVRYTDDVDLIVHLVSYPAWPKLQARLRDHGFVESPADDLTCRMRLGDLKVDFMPDDGKILGFENRWYKDAFQAAEPYRLTPQTTIRLLTPPYFLATKLEAYQGRGNNDPLDSKDVEDILTLVNGRPELTGELRTADPGLRQHVASAIQALLDHPDFLYAVQSCAGGDRGREAVIFERLEGICRLAES